MVSKPSPYSGVTAELSHWISNLNSSNVPPEIITRAKYLILDGIACGLVGARVPWSEKYVEATHEFEPPGEYSIIGYDDKFGPLPAAMMNATFIQACELDDYHSTAPLHSLSIILSALFAGSESQKFRPSKFHADEENEDKPAPISGLNFILAAIAGFETGPRAGKALYGTDMLARGWHCGPVFGAPAAAAAASKLFNLSPDETEDAIGIACTQACGLMSAQYEGMIKRVQHGFAARNGLLGALLARGGYSGIKKVFEREYGGYLSMFSQGNGKSPGYKEEEVVDALGAYWHTYAIRVKLYACVGTVHGTVEAMENLQRDYPEKFSLDNLSNVKHIHISLSEACYAHDGWDPEERPMTATGSQMNAAYIAAVQLIDGQVLLEQFGSSTLDRDEVWDLVNKTKCEHSVEFDKPDHVSGARVRVEFNDGSVVEEVVNMPKGFDPPIENEAILDKYRRLAETVVTKERMNAIEQTVMNLDKVDDVGALIKLLTGPVGRALD